MGGVRGECGGGVRARGMSAGGEWREAKCRDVGRLGGAGA